MCGAGDHGDGDDEGGLGGQPGHSRRKLAARPLVGPRRRRPRGLGAADPERSQRAQIVPELHRVAPEDLDGLQRLQRRVELRGVPVERVERLSNGLLLVALLGDRQVLDPRQRGDVAVNPHARHDDSRGFRRRATPPRCLRARHGTNPGRGNEVREGAQRRRGRVIREGVQRRRGRV